VRRLPAWLSANASNSSVGGLTHVVHRKPIQLREAGRSASGCQRPAQRNEPVVHHIDYRDMPDDEFTGDTGTRHLGQRQVSSAASTIESAMVSPARMARRFLINGGAQSMLTITEPRLRLVSTYACAARISFSL
jgi:hypothetical protein